MTDFKVPHKTNESQRTRHGHSSHANMPLSIFNQRKRIRDTFSDPRPSAATGKTLNRRNRIIRAITALLVSNLSSIVVQLISVPVFLIYWGAALYGEWLILFTIPGYLAISDFGIITVANNRIDALCARNRFASANRIYFTSTVILSIFFLLTLIGLTLLGYLFHENLTSIFRITPTSTVINIAALLCLDSLLAIFFNHNSALYRSIKRYDLTINWQTAGRLSSLSVLALSVAFEASLQTAALCMLVTRIIALCLMLWCIHRQVGWLKRKMMIFSLRENRLLLKLAGSYLILPISNILYLHFSVLLIGIFFNSTTVAIFSVLRNFTRLIPQLVGIAGRAVWAENVQALANGDLKLMRNMMNAVVLSTTAVCVCSAVGYMIFGKWIFELWTKNLTSFDNTLFIALVVHSIFVAFYTSIEVFVLSTNKHNEYAIFFFLNSSIQILLSYIFLTSLGPVAFPIFGAVGAGLISIFVLWKIYKQTDGSLTKNVVVKC